MINLHLLKPPAKNNKLSSSDRFHLNQNQQGKIQNLLNQMEVNCARTQETSDSLASLDLHWGHFAKFGTSIRPLLRCILTQRGNSKGPFDRSAWENGYMSKSERWNMSLSVIPKWLMPNHD